MSLAGGTISGDVTISGDLTVQGAGTNSFDEIIQGTVQITGDGGTMPTLSAGTNLVVAENSATSDGVQIALIAGATGIASIDFGDSGDQNDGAIFYDNDDRDLNFRTGGSGVDMTIDVNGNLGIGATPQSGWQSSYTALQLSNSVLYNNGGNDLFLGANFYFDGSNNKYITANGRASAIGLADGALKFFVSSSTTHSADDNVSFNQALTIDTSGNVGIGKTSLESTDSNWRSLELGGNGALINHSASGAGKAFIVSQNAYMVSNNFNTGMDYMDTDEASCYLQHSGTHTFRVAGSGTADASITWTDALAIDNSANATFKGDIFISNSTPLLRLDDSDVSTNVSLDGSGGIVKLASHTGQTVRFLIGSTEASRFNSSGYLGINDTNAEAHLTVSPSTVGTTSLGGRSINYGVNINTASGRSGVTVKPANNYAIGDDNAGFQWLYPFDDGGDGDFKAFRVSEGATLVDKFYATRDGQGYFASNVGIGTTSPIAGSSKTILTISNSAQSLLVFEDTGYESSGDGLGMFAYNDGTLTYRTASRSGTDFTGSTNRLVIDVNSRISLSNNDSGTANTVFGYEALNSFTATGHSNTVIGHQTARNASANAWQDNVAIGYRALYNSGAQNLTDCVIIGSEAGYSISSTAPDGTVAIGSSSLYSLSSGVGNTAIGYQALQGHTTGARNTVVGYQAMDGTGGATVLDSNDNTFMGYHAGGGTWTTAVCQYNVGIGNYALDGDMNDANYNTAVGYGSLGAMVSGDRNIGLGPNAGSTLTTGFDNICIGMGSNVSANDAQNRIAIGKDAVSSTNNTAVIGNSSVTDVLMAQDGEATIHCAGVKFPPSSALPDANANTLDDYEEGTWTPTFVSASGHAPTISATYVNDFTKVGNVVTVSLYIAFGNDGGGTDGVQISGLPTAIPANTFHMVPAVFRRTNFTSNIIQYGLTVSSTDDIGFFYTNATGDRVGLTYDDIDVASNNLILTFTYLDA
jgi:hypothetical protein